MFHFLPLAHSYGSSEVLHSYPSIGILFSLYLTSHLLLVVFAWTLHDTLKRTHTRFSSSLSGFFFFFFLKPPLITNFSPLDGGVPFPSLLCWWDLISFVRILYPRIQLALLITLLGCLRHNSKSVHLKHFHHLTKAWPSSSVTCPCELCTFFSDGKSVHLS